MDDFMRKTAAVRNDILTSAVVFYAVISINFSEKELFFLHDLARDIYAGGGGVGEGVGDA